MQQSHVRQPLKDTNFDAKENALTITAEMPGISKQDAKLGRTSNDSRKGRQKYHAELPVDGELNADTAKATYTNGILELKIKIRESPKQKSKGK